MALVTKFVRDPLAFIHNNLIIVGDTAVNKPAPQDLDGMGRMRLTLVDAGGALGYAFASRVAKRSMKKSLSAKTIGRFRPKRADSVYWVQKASANTAGEETFLSYVCPYEQDSALGTTLGPHANIMVTAEMTGCTFGVGMAAADKSCMVMHANSAKVATDTSTASVQRQEAAQAQSITRGLGLGAARFSTSDYRRWDHASGEDIRATLIGIRTNKGWEFYAQKFDAQGSDRIMLDVVKVG